MSTTNEISPPRFATVVRGYDRLQVDDFVERLCQWIEHSDHRAQQAEAEAARTASEAESLRRRLTSVGTSAVTATPESMKALGGRVGTIMQSSFQAAEEFRRQAEEGARSMTAEAEARALMMVDQAAQRADELSRAAEELFAQAKETLAGATAQVARLLDEARAHSATEHEAMVAQARRKAQELAGELAKEEQFRRERLAALEERRRQILRDIGLLQERLVSIGDGLTSVAELDETSEDRSLPPRGESNGDVAHALELPEGERPPRRRTVPSKR